MTIELLRQKYIHPSFNAEIIEKNKEELLYIYNKYFTIRDDFFIKTDFLQELLNFDLFLTVNENISFQNRKESLKLIFYFIMKYYLKIPVNINQFDFILRSSTRHKYLEEFLKHFPAFLKQTQLENRSESLKELPSLENHIQLYIQIFNFDSKEIRKVQEFNAIFKPFQKHKAYVSAIIYLAGKDRKLKKLTQMDISNVTYTSPIAIRDLLSEMIPYYKQNYLQKVKEHA